MDTGEIGKGKQFERIQRPRRRTAKVFLPFPIFCLFYFFSLLGSGLALNLEEKLRRRQDVKN